MSSAFKRLTEQLNNREEQLDQIRGAIALVEIEHLADAIADTDQGRQLRQVLTNISKLAG
jgi:hypothetical protein